jgi:hypothetical protein
LALAVLTGIEATVAAQQLTVAEGQAYGRLLNLWHARSLVSDANGDQSLALIARGNGDAFDRSFHDETLLLADRPMTDDLVRRAARGDVAFHGALADELNNSSGAEWDAAMDVLRAYRRFMGVDATVRARSQQGDQESATRLTLGIAQGQLGAAFATLDTALSGCIGMVQSEFDQAVSVTEYCLLGSAVLQLATLAVAFLAFKGLKPRMDEYKV